MDRIDIVLFPGFDELDAFGPYEVLRNAGFDVRFATLAGARPVTGAHGASVNAHGALRHDAELVIVPGGGWSDRAAHGAWGEARRGTLPQRLRELHARGTPIASVCTGAMILAAAGLTDGRPATTHHDARDELAASGADVRDERVVDDGDLLTAAGVTSGIDLALHLVERHRGAPVADAVAREMEHPRRPVAAAG